MVSSSKIDNIDEVFEYIKLRHIYVYCTCIRFHRCDDSAVGNVPREQPPPNTITFVVVVLYSSLYIESTARPPLH